MAGDENYQVFKFRGENNSQENLRKMTQCNPRSLHFLWYSSKTAKTPHFERHNGGKVSMCKKDFYLSTKKVSYIRPFWPTFKVNSFSRLDFHCLYSSNFQTSALLLLFETTHEVQMPVALYETDQY
jgi:hypothetical protein